MIEELQAGLKSLGYDFTPDMSKIDKWVDLETDNGKVSYKLIHIKDGFLCHLKNWSRDETHALKSTNLVEYSPTEYRELQEQAELELEARHENAHLKALSIIKKSGQNMTTPYMERKGIDSAPTTYQLQNTYGYWDLIIPMYDIDDKLWSIQTIEPEGQKSFLEGGRTKGLMHYLSLANPSDHIYVCEGFATGMSILGMLPSPALVVAAFSASNLKPVGEALREKYPHAHIWFCADNDHRKEMNVGLKLATEAALAVSGMVIYPTFEKNEPGTDWDDFVKLVGIDNAKEKFNAQMTAPNSLQHLVETNYGKVLKKKKPTKTKKQNDENTQTNFGDAEPCDGTSGEISETVGEENSILTNTLVQRTIAISEMGAESVDEEVKAKMEVAWAEVQRLKEKTASFLPHVTMYMNGLAPMELKIKNGKPVTPTEKEVAHYVHSYFVASNTPLKRWGEKDLFKYTGTHWQLLDAGDMIEIKNQISTALRGAAGATRVDSCYRTFFRLVDKMPRNPYITDPSKISFKNTTLHVEIDTRTREWSLRRAPHDPADFISHFIPFNLDESATNPYFLDMLDNIFTKKDKVTGTSTPDPEKQEKLKLLQEMYGACIAPIFPHLFLLYGPGGSGKTSLIKCAMRLVHDDAKASVEPCEMKGFVLQSVAGRLVNFVSDINTVEPIEDATVKRIEDRIPIRIDRKFKDAIMAPLPAVNIFGANGIPATKDQTSNAMMRRWSFVKMASMDRSEEPDYDYANWAFDQCPEGVLAWAIEGLKRLLSNQGKYSTFKSDRGAIREWQTGRDYVQQFLDDMQFGEANGVILDPEGKMKPGDLWHKFCAWSEFSNGGKPRFGKKTFYSSLENKGHIRKKTNTSYVFEGFRVDESGKNKGEVAQF